MTSIYVQAPMYGGLARGEWVASCLALQSYCIKNRIGIMFHMVYGESLVQRARNEITHCFLKSNYTHQLTSDCDIEFRPEDVIKLIQADKDIIGATYRLKRDEVKYVVNAIEGVTSTTEVSEVACIGTGLMLTKRHVYGKLQAAYPENNYVSDQDPYKGVELHAYYPVEIDPATRRLMSEDYGFCNNYRKIGGKVWIDPTIRLGHIGFKNYK